MSINKQVFMVILLNITCCLCFETTVVLQKGLNGYDSILDTYMTQQTAGDFREDPEMIMRFDMGKC